MTDLRIEEQIREDAEALEQDWDANPRWHGIERHYSAEDVIKLRGSFRVEHSVARAGAERLWRLVHEPARLWRRYLIEDIAALPVLAAMAVKRLIGQPLADLDLIDTAISSIRLEPAPIAPAPVFRSAPAALDNGALDSIAS